MNIAATTKSNTVLKDTHYTHNKSLLIWLVAIAVVVTLILIILVSFVLCVLKTSRKYKAMKKGKDFDKKSISSCQTDGEEEGKKMIGKICHVILLFLQIIMVTVRHSQKKMLNFWRQVVKK